MRSKIVFTVSMLLFLTFGVMSIIPATSGASKRPLEKKTFIHYKKEAKTAKGGVKTNACWNYLVTGAKWRAYPVNYVIDPDNVDGLSREFIANAVYQSAEEWDRNTGRELFGNYSIDYNASWDNTSPDGRNELLFGNYSDPNVIAVTVVWGYFSGTLNKRSIVEFDVLFDTDYRWGDATSDSTKMDLQNIATHEIGHGAGLADLYNYSCNQETMFGYSGYGETIKRTLNTGDILGIRKLYGR